MQTIDGFGESDKKSVLTSESVYLCLRQLFYTVCEWKKVPTQPHFNVCKGVVKSNFNS